MIDNEVKDIIEKLKTVEYPDASAKHMIIAMDAAQFIFLQNVKYDQLVRDFDIKQKLCDVLQERHDKLFCENMALRYKVRDMEDREHLRFELERDKRILKIGYDGR